MHEKWTHRPSDLSMSHSWCQQRWSWIQSLSASFPSRCPHVSSCKVPGSLWECFLSEISLMERNQACVSCALRTATHSWCLEAGAAVPSGSWEGLGRGLGRFMPQWVPAVSHISELLTVLRRAQLLQTPGGQESLTQQICTELIVCAGHAIMTKTSPALALRELLAYAAVKQQ